MRDVRASINGKHSRDAAEDRTAENLQPVIAGHEPGGIVVALDSAVEAGERASLLDKRVGGKGVFLMQGRVGPMVPCTAHMCCITRSLELGAVSIPKTASARDHTAACIATPSSVATWTLTVRHRQLAAHHHTPMCSRINSGNALVCCVKKICWRIVSRYRTALFRRATESPGWSFLKSVRLKMIQLIPNQSPVAVSVVASCRDFNFRYLWRKQSCPCSITFVWRSRSA